MASIVDIACAEAVDRHKDQKRDDNGSPFILHPMRSAGRLMLTGIYDDVSVAGMWLHDTPEDCAKDAAECAAIIQHIGNITNENVRDFVYGLTDPCKFDPELKSRGRKERKKIFRDFLLTQPLKVQRGKLIDRIDNNWEYRNDLMTGVCRKPRFVIQYADESELLITALKGADKALYEEAMEYTSLMRKAAIEVLNKQPLNYGRRKTTANSTRTD